MVAVGAVLLLLLSRVSGCSLMLFVRLRLGLLGAVCCLFPLLRRTLGASCCCLLLWA